MLILKAIAALLVTLGLISLAAYVFRKVAARHYGMTFNNTKKGRLTINDSKVLDMKHRLVVVGCDDKEYVILLGQGVAPQLLDTLSLPTEKHTKKGSK
jgi:flagellar protein FliO/FliZ